MRSGAITLAYSLHGVPFERHGSLAIVTARERSCRSAVVKGFVTSSSLCFVALYGRFRAGRKAAFDCGPPKRRPRRGLPERIDNPFGRVDDLNLVGSDPKRIGSFLRRSVRRSEPL